MEKKDVVAKLVQSNFINMIEREDIKALQEFKNSPEQIRDLITSMGASKELLEKPAHFEQLEECIKQIVDGVLDAMQDQKFGSKHKVGFDETNKLTAKIENFSTQDDYELEINKFGYRFKNVKLHTRLGSTTRTIQGNIARREIMDFRESDNLLEKEESGSKYLLDEYGFVIEEMDADRTITKENLSGEQSVKKNVRSSGSRISRNGNEVVNRNSGIVRWNGDALHLNERETSKSNLYKRALVTIAQCPSSKKYYEDILKINVEEMQKNARTQD